MKRSISYFANPKIKILRINEPISVKEYLHDHAETWYTWININKSMSAKGTLYMSTYIH